MSDMICSVLDRIMQAAIKHGVEKASNAIVVDVRWQLEAQRSNATDSNTVPVLGRVAIMKANKDSCCISSATAYEAEVANLLTLPSVMRAVENLLHGALVDVAMKFGAEVLNQFSEKAGEQCLLDIEKLSFNPEHVAAISTKLHPDVTFTDEALIFTTAVIQLIAGEVVELSVNHAIDCHNSAINARNVMSVVQTDPELFHCFGAILYRDAGTRVYNGQFLRYAWTENAVDHISQQVMDEHPEQDEEEVERQNYSEYIARNISEGASYIDARTGLLMHKVLLDSTLDRSANAATRESRKIRRDRAIADLAANNPLLLTILKQEHPLDASAESLRCLDLQKLSRSSREMLNWLTVSTNQDICKAAVWGLANSVLRTKEESTGTCYILTHEATNALQLALEHYLYQVLNDASGEAFVSGHTVVSPHHVLESMQASEVVMAACSKTFSRLAEIVSGDIASINCTFQCLSASSIACDDDDTALLDWLVEHGADLNLSHENPNAASFYGSPDNCLLFRAVKGNRKKVLDALLHRHSRLVNFAVEMNEGGLFHNRVNVLMVLSKMKDANLDLIEEFVSRGVDINAEGSQHNTAFTTACNAGNIAVAEKLILLGAETDKYFNPMHFRSPIDIFKNPDDRERLRKAKELVASPSLK